MTSRSAHPRRSRRAVMAASPVTFIRSAPNSTFRPRKPLDPHHAGSSRLAKAESAPAPAAPDLRYHARPRDAAGSGGGVVLCVVGNRRPHGVDFRLFGRI